MNHDEHDERAARILPCECNARTNEQGATYHGSVSCYVFKRPALAAEFRADAEKAHDQIRTLCADIASLRAEAEKHKAEVERLTRDLDQTKEALQSVQAGKALGPIVGAQTILNQQLEINNLQAELASLKEKHKAELSNLRVQLGDCIMWKEQYQAELVSLRAELDESKQYGRDRDREISEIYKRQVELEEMNSGLRSRLEQAEKITESLRRIHADPPPDIQELVIKKLDLVSREAVAAELASLRAENERLKDKIAGLNEDMNYVGFNKVCEERDHEHSSALIAIAAQQKMAFDLDQFRARLEQAEKERGEWKIVCESSMVGNRALISQLKAELAAAKIEGLKAAKEVALAEPRVLEVNAPDPQHRIADAIQALIDAEAKP